MLNRKHEGATVINISDNIAMKLYCYDLRKEWDEDYCPNSFLYGKVYKTFNIEIYTKNSKQKKKVRKGYYEDHVGFGNVTDLLLIKNKIFDISQELRDNEAIIIMGADERRFKIYEYFLDRDKRFEDIMICSNECIWIFNKNKNILNLLGEVYQLVKDESNGEYILTRNKKEVKKRDKEWEELML